MRLCTMAGIVASRDGRESWTKDGENLKGLWWSLNSEVRVFKDWRVACWIAGIHILLGPPHGAARRVMLPTSGREVGGRIRPTVL